MNRQEKHISLENKKDLNEFENNPLIDAGRKINEELLDLKMSDPCRICDECWYDLKIGPKNKMCQRCYNENKNMKSDPDVDKILKFSEENDMHPDMVPDCIKKLSLIELAAIKLVQPMFHIIQTKGGGLKMRGHSIALEQNIQEFATRLPNW